MLKLAPLCPLSLVRVKTVDYAAAKVHCGIPAWDVWRRWKYGVLSFKGVAELENKEWFEQLPFIVAVSVMAGVMGALFNIVHKRMFRVGASLFRVQSSAGPLHTQCAKQLPYATAPHVFAYQLHCLSTDLHLTHPLYLARVDIRENQGAERGGELPT